MKKIIGLFLLIIVAQSWGIIDQLDIENADRDITSTITVLTDTPDASNPMICQGLVYFGDGSKNLNGTGGNFELIITVGGQTIQPSPQVITFGTEARSAVWTSQFPVPANTEVILRVKSPNGADTDVDVTAYLYDVFPPVTIKDNAITAAAIQDAAIDNATFAADVGSTAYATNIIALAVRKVLDELKLDHLVAVADGDDPVDDCIIAKLASADGDWSKFDKTEDSLRALRVRGDVAWATATGTATSGSQTTMLSRLAAIMSKAAADPSVGTFDPATHSLEAQQENPQGPPIID